MLLFSILYGFWAANLVAFNGSALRELAAQFLAIAKKQKATVPLMIGHRLMATSLTSTGDLVESLAHYDQAIAMYDPAEHRSLATRFGQDVRVAAWSYRSLTLWLLGRPESALTDVENAIKDARETSHAATLLYALTCTNFTQIVCRDYEAVRAQSDEVIALADEKVGAPFWKAHAIIERGCLLALTGKAADAASVITSGLGAYRSTGATLYVPWHLSSLASAHADLGQFDEAWRCIHEAMTTIETGKERVWEAEVNRVAGQIALKSPERGSAKAEEYFERALAVARQQQAKSWELRASMSLARLWRDQGKVQQARELLASVYGWFTEGFETRDLKEAKALLEELSS
jgi:predicted ATPase